MMGTTHTSGSSSERPTTASGAVAATSTATPPKRAGAIIGVGTAACVACCAGPILGLLASIGIATVAGVLVFGLAGLLVAVAGVFAVSHRRRINAAPTQVSVPIEIGTSRGGPDGSR